jgi:hypothetical protein
MPVFFTQTKRVLFVHVPKAGGTSIEQFFEANGFKTAYLDRGGSPESLNPQRRCSPQHMHAALLDALFDTASFDYVFMTVRHPMRRLLSKFTMENPGIATADRLEAWILRVFGEVAANPAYLDNHLRPQSDFFLRHAEVFRLEDGFGPAFVSRLRDRIGARFGAMPVNHEMQSREAAIDETLIRPALRSMILAYYRKDFETFGY